MDEQTVDESQWSCRLVVRLHEACSRSLQGVVEGNDRKSASG